jgi:hypothetical protein
VGLFATLAGDLATGRDNFDASIRHDREAEDWNNLSLGLQNLAASLAWLGRSKPCAAAAAEALTYATTSGNQEVMRAAHTSLGWAADLAGDTAAAERQFMTADRIHYRDEGHHLGRSVGAVVGTHGPARAVA